jgi:hypothetical protein
MYPMSQHRYKISYPPVDLKHARRPAGDEQPLIATATAATAALPSAATAAAPIAAAFRHTMTPAAPGDDVCTAVRKVLSQRQRRWRRRLESGGVVRAEVVGC